MENLLQQCSLFKGLPAEAITPILDKYQHQVKAFREKDFVIFQNDSCENLMIVIQGLVQAQMVDSTGKLIIIEELGVAQLLAPAFIFPDVNRMPVSVLALETTQILYFRKPVLLQIMQENQTILTNFLNMISNRSRFLSEKLKFHAFMSIRDKISHYLISEHNKQESLHIRLRHTQQELADMFGIARPSLARAFADMEKSGIIRVKNKDVDILDLKELKKNIDSSI